MGECRLELLNKYSKDLGQYLPGINRLLKQRDKEAAEVEFGQLFQTVRKSELWIILNETNELVGMVTIIKFHTLTGVKQKQQHSITDERFPADKHRLSELILEALRRSSKTTRLPS
jgi:hypothetical protein